MAFGASHYVQRCVPLIVLVVLLAHLRGGFCSTTAAESSQAERNDPDPHDPHPFCYVEFADSYFATIATTMPIADHAPLAQTGHLYVDRAAEAVRIDQFFRNHRTTFLLDHRRLRGFLFFGERDFQRTSPTTAVPKTTTDYDDDDAAGDSADDADAVQHRCHVFYLTQKLAPFCVPQSYTAQPSPSVIRGVATTRFTGMEGFANMPLVEQSFYVINTSASEAADATASPSFTPWRLEYRARPDLEPHKIAGAPFSLPNWRFFGHPMFDELVLSPAQEYQLQFWQPTVDLLTIDFYDVYPTEHDEDTFAVPPQCQAMLHHDGTTAAAGGRANATESDGSDQDAHRRGATPAPRLQLATLQRFLLQWHLLQNASAVSIAGGDGVLTTPMR